MDNDNKAPPVRIDPDGKSPPTVDPAHPSPPEPGADRPLSVMDPDAVNRSRQPPFAPGPNAPNAPQRPLAVPGRPAANQDPHVDSKTLTATQRDPRSGENVTATELHNQAVRDGRPGNRYGLMVGHVIHFYTDDDRSHHASRGRGPYAAMVVGVLPGGERLDLKVFHQGGMTDELNVPHEEVAAAESHGRYWTWMKD